MKLTHLCIPAWLLIACSSFGQSPVITNVDKYKEGAGRRITIAGSNFGTTPANIAVYFGAQKGTIVSVADKLIEVTVPPGATLEHITVTNTLTGLTAFSDQQFAINYGGEHPFSTANLTAQENFDGESGLYDICLCDLDGDGKTDVAASNDKDAQTLISLFRNISTGPGNINYAKTTISTGTRSLHVACGDLNGDGKKDLVVSEGGAGERLFILRNNSTPGTFTFAAPQAITLTGKQPKRIEINDLDMNGKPDLIVTDQKNENKNLLILPNTSTLSTISFGAVQSVVIPSVADRSSTDGLAVHDVNGDRLPELVVTQFQTTNSNVFILKNESTSGTFRFTSVTTLTLSGAPVSLRMGNMNGDSKPDIAVTQLLSLGITTFVNESTLAEIKFATGSSTLTDDNPSGIDLGDLDGDGKLDAVVTSLTKKTLTILNNTSTGATITFGPKQQVTTQFVTRHVKLGDLDGDGKPDVAFASVDDPSGPASRLSVFRNKSCIVPRIDPTGPLIMCSGFPTPLEASVSAGATYQWKKGGVDIATATAANFTPTAPTDLGTAQYTVTMTAESGACVRTSSATQVEVISQASLPAPTLLNDSPICKGATLTISADSGPTATGYRWTGPAGFTATVASGPVTRSNFEAGFAGRYEVDVLVNTCVAQKGFIIAEMITLPDFKVGFTGNDIICTGSSKTMSVDPIGPGFTYQWFTTTGGAIGSATANSHSVSASGEYFYQAQSTDFPACPPASSNKVTFKLVKLPTMAFTSPASTCTGTVVTFTNQSTLDADAGANYIWDFGDSTPTSDAISPTHTYATTGTFNVKLVASYRGNTCSKDLIKQITVTALPTATITSTTSAFSFCPGDKLILGVSTPFTSYLWSTNETTATIEVSAAATYSVQLTNAVGCKITPTQVVTQLVPPVVTATAERAAINIGESTQLTATPGLASYLWEPAETLSGSNIANPVATPEETTTYTVVGTASNGCTGEAAIAIEVTFDDIVNLLQPGNFISPNGDAINDTWEVGRITSFPQCGVKIFDEKGSKVYDALPYQNDWNAVLNGKPLPNGVYFYFIQCEGESESKTGSITVVH